MAFSIEVTLHTVARTRCVMNVTVGRKREVKVILHHPATPANLAARMGAPRRRRQGAFVTGV